MLYWPQDTDPKIKREQREKDRRTKKAKQTFARLKANRKKKPR